MYSRRFFTTKLACFVFLFIMTVIHIADAQDKITGPWLWMIVPTALGQGGARSTDIDSLAAASDGYVTEAYIAQNGANEGETVGKLAWTLAHIKTPTRNIDDHPVSQIGNINDVVNRIGWAKDDVNDHSAYALITIASARDQRVRMRVGSDDSIKVWLNGKVVHKNRINRSSSGFQDNFSVNLVAGDNLLLVKVSEATGKWDMFVGIDANVNAIYKPSTVLSISPFPTVSPLIGDQFSVNVDITNGENIAGYQFRLTYDTTSLRYVGAQQNTGYLSNEAFIASPKVSGNTVTIAATSLSGVSQGDGTLAYIVFDVVAYKASRLELDGVKLVDSQGNALSVRVKDGRVIQRLGDINVDGVVNIQDLVRVANSFGKTGQTGADVNDDGVVDIADLVLVAGALQAANAAPSLHTQSLEMLSATNIRQWLSQAHQLDINDAQYQRGILMLEHLLAVLAPKETALLPNYPNPFNPETWIPYQIAAPADVVVQIYTINGALVKTLALGHQSAGVYQDKSRAAYWDGTNELGETVSSGVYFYTLKADDFSATQKMLIRK